MRNIHYEHRHLEVACGLEAVEAGTRATEWRRLREEAGQGSDWIPGGARLWLQPESQAVAEDLAEREAICCGFLDIDLASDGDRLRLDLTSLAPDAAPVIACIAGLEPRCSLRCC
jgi:hypothetical protein